MNILIGEDLQLFTRQRLLGGRGETLQLKVSYKAGTR